MKTGISRATAKLFSDRFNEIGLKQNPKMRAVLGMLLARAIVDGHILVVHFSPNRECADIFLIPTKL